MTNACEHATTIFDDSTHALKVSFQIMQAILFRHLIGVNCILYMAPDPISEVSNVLIYPTVMVSNRIITIRQALVTFTKPDMYIE